MQTFKELTLRDLKKVLREIAGKKQCEMCGGDGKSLSFHKSCTCFPLRRAIRRVERLEYYGPQGY